MDKDQKLHNAVMKLAVEVKHWPEHQKKPVRDFVKVIQDLISDHEMECLSYDVAIRKHIANSITREDLLKKIMETYAIDITQACRPRTYNQIMIDYDLAVSCGVYKTPEKIPYERIRHSD